MTDLWCEYRDLPLDPIEKVVDIVIDQLQDLPLANMIC